MSTVIEKFVAEVGWDVDPKGVQQFGKQVNSIVGIAKKVALAFTGATAGALAFLTITNKQTAELTQLAHAFGLSGEALERYTDLFQNIGVSSQEVIKSIKTLNDRIGQIKGGTAYKTVTDSIKMLGLSIEDLKKLEPEKQFEAILSAAKNAEDRQVGLAAATQLMGRSASRMVGHLQQYDESLEDILDRYARLDMMTEEGRQGAIRFSTAMNEVRTLVTSLKGLIAGLVGEALTPMIDKFTDWAVNNRELIKIKVREWVDSIVRALKFMLYIAKGIKSIIDSFGGLTNIIKLVAVAFASLKIVALTRAISLMTAGLKASAIASMALKGAWKGIKSLGMHGIIALGILAIQDLYVALSGGKSAFEPLHNAIGKFLAEDVAGFISGLIGIDTATFNWIASENIQRAIDIFKKDIPEALSTTIQAFELGFPIIGNVVDNVINSIIGFVNNAIAAIQKLIDLLPFTKTLKNLVPGAKAIIEQTGGYRMAPATVPIVGNVPFRNAPNAPSNVSSTANVNAPITINQLPGESSENLSKRIVKELNTQVAQAVRNNDTGIVR